MLSDDLLHRLRARAADPATRTDSYTPPQGRSFFGGAFQTRTINLDGSPVTDPAPLPAPATDTDIAIAEARLGCSFPTDLAQIYRSVANGGFGPGDGLAPLDAMADRYLAFRAEPMGPEGEPWPANLLPITLTEPGADCLDLDTGRNRLLGRGKPGRRSVAEVLQTRRRQPRRVAGGLARLPTARRSGDRHHRRGPAREHAPDPRPLARNDTRTTRRIRTVGGRLGRATLRPPRHRPQGPLTTKKGPSRGPPLTRHETTRHTSIRLRPIRLRPRSPSRSCR